MSQANKWLPHPYTTDSPGFSERAAERPRQGSPKSVVEDGLTSMRSQDFSTFLRVCSTRNNTYLPLTAFHVWCMGSHQKLCESGRETEDAREEFGVNRNKTEGGGSPRLHGKLRARARKQALSFYVAEMRWKAPSSYWNNEDSKLNTPALGKVSYQFSSTQKGKRICFSIKLALAAINSKH